MLGRLRHVLRRKETKALRIVEGMNIEGKMGSGIPKKEKNGKDVIESNIWWTGETNEDAGE